MKNFEFVAFDSSGRKKWGALRASGLSEAKRKIQQKGLYLASLRLQEPSIFDDQSSFSFLKQLKEFLFSKEKITV